MQPSSKLQERKISLDYLSRNAAQTRLDDVKFRSQAQTNTVEPIEKIDRPVPLVHVDMARSQRSTPAAIGPYMSAMRVQPDQAPIPYTPYVPVTNQQPLPVAQDLNISRKSGSSSGAKDLKDKFRDSFGAQNIAETRIVQDPIEKQKLMQGVIASTPPTAEKFWKDALKESRIQIHYTTESPEEVSPVFRYCFLCQNSILEYNISHHEKVCPSFLQLYNKTGEEIAVLVEAKIGRLRKEIKHKIEEIDRKGLSEVEVMSSLKEFMNQCDVVQKRGNHVIHYEYESKFMKVQDCWRDVKLLELAHRLRWFMRIRQQLSTRFGL